MTTFRSKGRPNRYSQYEQILANNPPQSMIKRPVYANGIGVFRGKSGDTAFIKIFLRTNNAFLGRNYAAGSHVEIKLGNLTSWDWASLEARKQELQGKADRGEPLEETPPKGFKEYGEEWLVMAKVRQKSYSTSKYTVEANLYPYFARKFLKDISVRDVNEWQTQRLKVVKPATVQREKNMLKAILNNALKESLIERNPCNASNNIKGIQPRQRFWSPEEMQKLFKIAKEIDPQFADYMLWALHSGMRRGEILNLKWQDVLVLANDLTKINIATSKSGKSRQNPCNEQMLQILERQRSIRSNENDNIFHFTNQMIKRRVEKLRNESKVPDIRLHDLRKSNVTLSLHAGVDAKTIAGITGHSNLEMIQKYYAIIVDEAATLASKKVGDIISHILS